MKTILIATDFSANAKHAAEYGYSLAAQFKADIILCNAFIVPAEVPEAGLSIWPAMEYEELNKGSKDELKELKNFLLKSGRHTDFKPAISYLNDSGFLADVLTNAAIKQEVGMTVMATHGADVLNTFFIGNHSRKMIDAAKGLLMLVPPAAHNVPIKKIAFATDFKEPQKDLKIIYELIRVIRPLNAELLVTHITEQQWPDERFRKSLEQFLIDISNKADYPHIYYRIVRSGTPEKGLGWLCDHGQIDVLAMVHRERSFLSHLFSGSHTKKMANLIHIPLLVIPETFAAEIPNRH